MIVQFSTLLKVFILRVKVVDNEDSISGTVPPKSHHSMEPRGKPSPIGSILIGSQVVRISTPVLKISDLVKYKACRVRVIRLIRFGTLLRKVSLTASKGYRRLDVSVDAENIHGNQFVVGLEVLLIWQKSIHS